MLQATFMIALLLITLGRLLTSMKSWASKRSMSSLFHCRAAIMEVPV